MSETPELDAESYAVIGTLRYFNIHDFLIMGGHIALSYQMVDWRYALPIMKWYLWYTQCNQLTK